MFCSDVTQILVDVAFHFGASMRAVSSSKYDPSSTVVVEAIYKQSLEWVQNYDQVDLEFIWFDCIMVMFRSE